MARVSQYVTEVEANASQMSSAERAVYVYRLIDAIYYGAKKSGMLTEDDKAIGQLRDEALNIAQPNESLLAKENLKKG